MDIEINYSNIDKTDALDEHVRAEIDHHLGNHLDRLTRIVVHLGDENGPKAGSRDKRCMIEQRPRGGDPIAVEAHGSDMYDTISDAGGKAKRAIETWVGKREAV